jgi:hypothetical protein
MDSATETFRISDARRTPKRSLTVIELYVVATNQATAGQASRYRRLWTLRSCKSRRAAATWRAFTVVLDGGYYASTLAGE